MVNYNNDVTIATPSTDINRIQILERRAYVIEALEQYYQFKYSGAGGNDRIFKSRLASLFWELQETLKRKFPKNGEKISYEEMKAILFPEKGSPPFNKIVEVWENINLMLGEINLTKIDTKKEYDSTNIEEENRVQKL